MELLKRSRSTEDDIQHISTNKINKEKNLNSPSKKIKISSPQKNSTKNQLSSMEDDFNKWFDDDDDDFHFINDENSPVNSQEVNVNSEVKNLDLTQWTRCIVQKIERDLKNFDLILNLTDETDKTKSNICRLQGPWCRTKICDNDLISIKGIWNSTYNCFVVNAADGIIITNPDYLISGTSVVGSLFCPRKGVLQDKFRGLDADNKVMLIGSIIHEVLQTVLVKKLRTLNEVENLVQKLLNSNEMMFTLFASKISIKEIKCEVEKFLPNIVNFIDQYIEQKGSSPFAKDMFQGSIDKIQDIEENLWIPQLGLKGKIDVSVMATKTQKRLNKNSMKSNEKYYMPLELKTGKASFSSEHKGQLILYQMMLKEIGKNVNSGLLLYLRDCIMKEIPSTRNEQRDLIILRNELSYYLTRNINYKNNCFGTSSTVNINDFQFENTILPEPINHHSACAKCPYQTICSTYLKTDENYKFDDNNPLKVISKECTSHLKNSDIQYFIHWCGLLSLEDEEIKKSSYNIRNLWTENPEDRYKNGRALINLKISGNVEFNGQKYIHHFESVYNENNKCEMKTDFTLSVINIGDYVIVSCHKRIALATGFVYDLNKNSVTLTLERNLLQNYSMENFIIDKIESQTLNLFNYTNLGVLIDNTSEMNRLREIIIEKIKPTFMKVLPKIVATQGMEILMNLNKIQRKAVMKALTANDYMLIKGLPGTGKTQTLIAIIRLFYLMKKSVLITSHTHSAVDNVLIRLKSHNVPFLRLGSATRISSQIHENSEIHLTKNCKTAEDLEKMYSSFNIVGVTCLGTSHSLFIQRKFDICIIDESTQVFQPTTLRPLFYSEKFILVGDPEQLPPVIRSKIARNLNAEETLFNRLDSNDATAILTLQYRMNKTITKLANDLTYNGNLICGNETIMKATIHLPNEEILMKNYCSDQKWISYALGTHIDQSVILLNTQNCLNQHLEFENNNDVTNNEPLQMIEERFKEIEMNGNDGSLPLKAQQKLNYTNYCEIAIIFVLTKCLLKCNYKAENIGIIASYRAQVELLKKFKENFQNHFNNDNENLDFKNIEVNTVDQYQGRDKEIIFYSCTRTNNYTDQSIERKKESEILEDQRRLTVAITRSKHKLIIVGDENCLTKYTPFRNLFTKISNRCKLILDDGKFGFSWNQVLDEIKIVIKKRK